MNAKRCEACKTPLAPKVFECGKVESPAMFKARRFCDRTCKMLRHRPHRNNPRHPWKLTGLRTLGGR
jgi:hypothetical protein